MTIAEAMKECERQEREEMNENPDFIPYECEVSGCPGPWCWKCRKGCENVPNSAK